jgi:hypothetical protein
MVSASEKACQRALKAAWEALACCIENSSLGENLPMHLAGQIELVAASLIYIRQRR